MARATRPTEKLLQVAKGGAGRRQRFSTATRRTLVTVAREQFATQGYAGTSLDTIVAGASVTKGALYHHFSGKQALFEAVFESIETDATAEIAKALTSERDPWDKAMDGLRAFLRVVREPTYQRIVIQEGPAVLGYERFREQEERTTFALVHQLVHEVLSTTSYGLDEEMMTTFTRIFFGAMSAAGESVTAAADPELAVARVEAAIGFMLLGLRTLADHGVPIADLPLDTETGAD